MNIDVLNDLKDVENRLDKMRSELYFIDPKYRELLTMSLKLNRCYKLLVKEKPQVISD